MDTSVEKTLISIVATLKSKGLTKYAEEVEAAGYDMSSGVGRWFPSMMQPGPVRDQPIEVSPTDPQEFAYPGELVVDIDADGNEKFMAYGFVSPMTIDELLQAVRSKSMAVKYLADMVNASKDQDTRYFWKNLLDMAVKEMEKRRALGAPTTSPQPTVEKMTPEQVKTQSGLKNFLKNLGAKIFRKQKAKAKLAAIGTVLTERGYEALGRRVFETAEMITKQ